MLAAVVAVLVFAVWVVPKPRYAVVPVDGSPRWADSDELQQRRIVWQPSVELSSIVPPDMANASLIAPRFADGGTSLYFTLRSEGGQADIYRSRLTHGEWAAAEPVTSLNSASDDIGAVPSSDGRQLFLYSNRSGGLGGFDVYVSKWQDGDWTLPANVGTPVNSTADEYDPAISPDGRSLYFASNRDRAAAARGPTGDEPGDAWSGTLRHRESNTIDVYVGIRDDIDAPWKSVASQDAINRPDSNEGAPFVPSNGAFLYFASDRTVRVGEKRNLDLFRSNIATEMASAAVPENLGPGINTPDHETEPALSPEGFTLVFSAHRDGNERLFLSRAEEIRYETAWDTSNFDSMLAIWTQALLLTLVVLVIAALLIAARGKISKAAASGQFFAGSLVFHVLLLFLLAMWNLPGVMEVITSKKFDAEASTQLFDDNQHQSHEDGRAAYEKLADLQSLEDVPQSDVVRQETESFSVPERNDSPLPTIPMEVARRLPPERLLFVPPNRAQPQPAAAKNDLTPALSRPAPAIAQAVPELAKAAVELPEPVASPGERPIATQIDMPRSELQVPPVQFDIKVPNAMKLRMKSTTNLTPPAVEIGQERMATTLRLGVAALDCLQLHCIPIDELRKGDVFDWLRALKSDGAICEFGASVESVEEGLLCVGQDGLVSLQVIFNLFRQKLVTELFPQAQAAGVSIIVRLPLASGLLSGKFTRRSTFTKGDHRNYNRDGQAFNVGETFAGLPFEKGVELANEIRVLLPQNITMAQAALRWILDHDAVTTIIPGASSPEQVTSNAAVSDLPRLSDELHKQLSEFYQSKVAQHIRGPY